MISGLQDKQTTMMDTRLVPLWSQNTIQTSWEMRAVIDSSLIYVMMPITIFGYTSLRLPGSKPGIDVEEIIQAVTWPSLGLQKIGTVSEL